MTKPQLKQKSITSFFKKPASSPASTRAVVSSPAPIAARKVSDVKPLATPPVKQLESTVDREDFHIVSSFKRSAPVEEPSSQAKKRLIVISDDEDDENLMSPPPVSRVPAKIQASTPRQPVANTPKSTFSAKSFAATPRVFPETPLNTRVVSTTPSFTTGEDRKKARQVKFNQKNEEKYGFLDDMKDGDGRRPSDPDYDPRTLYIPQSFWRNASPFERQYWEIKCKHFDTVVFFKKGKFYELFERDADLGSRLFDLKLTDRGHMRMVGVPEASFSFWASKFIARGHKVSKVDQMETALGKEMRDRDATKKSDKDDIVRRELTAVLTGGTLIDGNLLTDDQGTYCLAIKEEQLELTNDLVSHCVNIGVAFVDTSTAEVFTCHFADDTDRSVLATLLVQLQPKEILYEKSCISAKSMKVLKDSVGLTTMWSGLKSGSEFWDSFTAMEEFNRGSYLDSSTTEHRQLWQNQLELLKESPNALSAFGALLWYLRSLKLDTQLISQGRLSPYDPIKRVGSLVLDGQTLINLEIFKTSDGDVEGSLFHLLNRAATPFGKRLLKRWVCHPLTVIAQLEDRLDAVDVLISKKDVIDDFHKSLSRLPDLERSLTRVHTGTCKLKEFLGTLQGFISLESSVCELAPYVSDEKSDKLTKLCTDIAAFDLTSKINGIKSTFDMQKAKADGVFEIKTGVENDFDEILEEVSRIEKELNDHLKEQKKALECSELKFKDLGKELYQIEVPLKAVTRVPNNWLKRSGTKSVSRFHSPFLVKKVREYQEAMEKKTVILAQLFQRVLGRMDAMSVHFKSAIKLCAELDCLVSLAKVSSFLAGILGGDVCRPEFIENDGGSQGHLEVENLRHPCLVANTSTEFVANNLNLGGNQDQSSMILLTGPNMGGKSTMLRQSCIVIVMAQLGCHVPASKCRMTIFDRIFTRIGANDNILAGQSTFMVELTETARILSEATPRSMVILDELGRGTSTFDGYGIAYSVLTHLATKIKCLGLFSTHYGLLTGEYAKLPSVRMMYMQCIANANERDVTFLYKLIDGVSPKSYGMNVAHMAGIPDSVVERAENKAAAMVGEKGWIGAVGMKKQDGATGGAHQNNKLMMQNNYGILMDCAREFKEKGGKLTAEKRMQMLGVWRASKCQYV